LDSVLKSARTLATIGLFLSVFTGAQESRAQSGKYARFEAEAVGLEYVRDDSNRFLDWSHEDASAWFTSWDATRVGYVAGATAGLVGLSLADESVSAWAKGINGSVIDPFLNTTNELGGPAIALLPIAIFAGSLASDNVQFQDAAFTSLQSYVYSNIVSLAIKFAVGRSRPDAGKGPYDFHPFSGADSFPSGHTTSAFAIVIPWVFYYPGPATYVLASLAFGTALARVQKQRHWLTDVVAGAVISTTMSYFLYTRHRDAQSVQAGIGSIGKGPVGLGSVGKGPTMRLSFQL
jgi:membrane-associated phospholipid phosphatase